MPHTESHSFFNLIENYTKITLNEPNIIPFILPDKTSKNQNDPKWSVASAVLDWIMATIVSHKNDDVYEVFCCEAYSQVCVMRRKWGAKFI